MKFNQLTAKRIDAFTLVEVMVSMIIMLVGLISVAELFAVALREDSFSFNHGAATLAAQDKLEELRGLSFTDAQLQFTPAGQDSLAANVDGYNDTAGNFIRRWSVTVGPTLDTRVVTLRVIPVITDPRRAKQRLEISTILTKAKE